MGNDQLVPVKYILDRSTHKGVMKQSSKPHLIDGVLLLSTLYDRHCRTVSCDVIEILAIPIAVDSNGGKS